MDQRGALDDKDVWTWTIALRGETYRRLGRYQEALADLNRAIDLDGKLAWAVAMRGETYRQMGNYEAALADFTWVSTLDSQDRWVAEQLALTSRHMRQVPSTGTAAQQSASTPINPWLPLSNLGEGQPFIPYPTSAASAPAPYEDNRHLHQHMPPIPPTPQTPASYMPPDPFGQPPIPSLPYAQPPVPPVPMARRENRGLRIVAFLVALVMLMLIIGVILAFIYRH